MSNEPCHALYICRGKRNRVEAKLKPVGLRQVGDCLTAGVTVGHRTLRNMESPQLPRRYTRERLSRVEGFEKKLAGSVRCHFFPILPGDVCQTPGHQDRSGCVHCESGTCFFCLYFLSLSLCVCVSPFVRLLSSQSEEINIFPPMGALSRTQDEPYLESRHMQRKKTGR